MADTGHSPTTTGAISAAISNSVTRLVKEHTGRGPTSARTVIDSALVFVVLGEIFTSTERRLIDLGRIDLASEIRRELDAAMRDDLIAAVEMVLQRKVTACMSDHNVDPDYGIKAFVLEPSARDRLAEAPVAHEVAA